MISRSTCSTAVPMSSTVTVEAAQGILSPLLISNTRQSLRKSIIRLLELFDFVEKLLGLLELAHEADVANVSHLVERAKFRHYTVGDLTTGDVGAAPLGRKIVEDALNDFIHLLAVDGKVVANAFQACAQLVVGEIFRAFVFPQDPQLLGLFDLFVGGVTGTALEAFAAATDGGTCFRRPGVDHLIFLALALRAMHTQPTNCVAALW